MPEHPFWWILTMACVAWYSTITVYVAVKGVADLKTLLERLSPGRGEEERRPPPEP